MYARLPYGRKLEQQKDKILSLVSTVLRV